MAASGGSGKRPWLVDVEKTLEEADASVEVSQWQRHSIYRVPACIKDLKPRAYRPQVVSLGPLHHGDPELVPMEEHKRRALRHLFRRAKQPLEAFAAAVEPVEEVVEQLESAYLDLGDQWRGKEGRERFLEIMIMDGCFLLEVMRAASLDWRSTARDYAPNDPSSATMGCSTWCPTSAVICSYSKTRSNSDSLCSIRFRHGVLSMPAVVVDDSTEYMFLNMMAFERLHVGAGNDVTEFVFFMDSIINSVNDVALLSSCGIIQNAVGSDKVVVRLFASISKDAVLEPESALEAVLREMIAYCEKPWNKWRANIIHNYFRSPTSFLNFLAAVTALVMTVIQTAYTIMAFYNQLSNAAQRDAPPPM
ncbi:unnamed protein product [Urochloa decumbens]|uniref:Uncharacterized protein n=1 Tax=Urochloa decumbens TaxID=240449 RepID=A0ABC9B876_9POAL